MERIDTPLAPAAIGPYSQAIRAGNLVFCSGQIPIDPKTGEIASADIAVQTLQVLENLRAVLVAAGAAPWDVVKTTVFLQSMADFPAMNQVYGSFFGEHRPARATVEVSRLPKDVLVEIEAIAVV